MSFFGKVRHEICFKYVILSDDFSRGKLKLVTVYVDFSGFETSFIETWDFLLSLRSFVPNVFYRSICECILSS